PFVVVIAVIRLATLEDARTPVRWFDGVLAAVALLVATTAATWYVLNWHAMLGHVAESMTGDKALLYGSGGPALVKLVFWFTKLLQMLSLFSFLSLLMLLIGVAGLTLAFTREWQSPSSPWLRRAARSGTLYGLCLGATVVVELLAYSRMIEE